MRRKIWSAKDLETNTAASGGEGTNQLGGEGVTRGGESVTRGGEGRPDFTSAGGGGTDFSDIRLKDRIERIGAVSIADAKVVW